MKSLAVACLASFMFFFLASVAFSADGKDKPAQSFQAVSPILPHRPLSRDWSGQTMQLQTKKYQQQKLDDCLPSYDTAVRRRQESANYLVQPRFQTPKHGPQRAKFEKLVQLPFAEKPVVKLSVKARNFENQKHDSYDSSSDEKGLPDKQNDIAFSQQLMLDFLRDLATSHDNDHEDDHVSGDWLLREIAIERAFDTHSLLARSQADNNNNGAQ